MLFLTMIYVGMFGNVNCLNANNLPWIVLEGFVETSEGVAISVVDTLSVGITVLVGVAPGTEIVVGIGVVLPSKMKTLNYNTSNSIVILDHQVNSTENHQKY